jgi:FkbM family methyltransferase
LGEARDVNDVRRVLIGDRVYCLVSDDDYLASFGGTFDPDLTRLFHLLVREQDTVVDVGANVGCTSILFAALAHHVYAFEPSPSTYAFLRLNLKEARVLNVQTFNLALGAVPGRTRLIYARNNRSGAFVAASLQPSEGHVIEEVQMRTLDDVVESAVVGPVDVIKIDVEGFEAKVIEGAERVLQRDRPIVVLELNHWCLNAFQRTSVPDFLDFLRARFPLLLAVHGSHYLDLHDSSDSYVLMYRHIVHMQFPNIVAGFNRDRLLPVIAALQRGAPA